MRTSLPFLFAIGALPVVGQTQNALDFDGIDDQVVVSGTAALLAGSTVYSMSMWVNPQNANPAWPDFDGFAGFRDDVGADLYITQVGPTTVEARFRNSSGTPFDISYTGVPLNTWSHMALVVDGTSMILYHNGAAVATVPASGTLSATPGDFLIGNSYYAPNTNFWLDGQVDEVGLWKRALLAEEIQCLVGGSADLTDPELVLYYGFDQGTPGGNNTSITSLTDAMGNMNGTFEGLALTGAGSNFVEGAGIGLALNGTTCPGVGYPYDGQLLTAGSYSFTYTSVSGCDSVVTVTVSEIPVNVNVLQNGATLSSLNGSASWQWLDCGNGFAAIPGATFQIFSPTVNGSYAVEVTTAECVDTSACYNVTTIGLNEFDGLLPVRLVPAVTQGPLRLLLDAPLGILHISVCDDLGRPVMRSQNPAKAEHWLDVSGLAPGCYTLLATANGKSRALRFVRE